MVTLRLSMKSLAATAASLVLALGCISCKATSPSVKTLLASEVPDASEPMRAHAELHMDADFNDFERSVIADAVKIWKIQTGGLADISVVYDLDFNSILNIQEHTEKDHHTVVKLEAWMPQVQAMDGDGKVLGWMGPTGGIHNPWHKPIHGAFVPERWTDREYSLQVVIHEFGHVLGVPHSPAVQGIMYPHIVSGRKACLKTSDLAAFCQVNTCGTAKMVPCE